MDGFFRTDPGEEGSFVHEGPEAGHRYFYYAFARGRGVASWISRARAILEDTAASGLSVLQGEMIGSFVRLVWREAREGDWQGFPVWRREAGSEGEYACLTVAPLSSRSGYSYDDHGVKPEHTYLYLVEGLRMSGQSDWFGPISVEVDTGPIRLEVRRVVIGGNEPEVMRLSLAIGGDVVVSIYYISGRLIRRLIDRPLSSGVHEILWDGCTDTGSRASSGVNLCKADVASGMLTDRLVLIR